MHCSFITLLKCRFHPSTTKSSASPLEVTTGYRDNFSTIPNWRLSMRCCPLFQSQGPADFRCGVSVHFLPVPCRRTSRKHVGNMLSLERDTRAVVMITQDLQPKEQSRNRHSLTPVIFSKHTIPKEGIIGQEK